MTRLALVYNCLSVNLEARLWGMGLRSGSSYFLMGFDNEFNLSKSTGLYGLVDSS